MVGGSWAVEELDHALDAAVAQGLVYVGAVAAVAADVASCEAGVGSH